MDLSPVQNQPVVYDQITGKQASQAVARQNDVAWRVGLRDVLR
jgi:hypothetical protein